MTTEKFIARMMILFIVCLVVGLFRQPFAVALVLSFTNILTYLVIFTVLWLLWWAILAIATKNSTAPELDVLFWFIAVSSVIVTWGESYR